MRGMRQFNRIIQTTGEIVHALGGPAALVILSSEIAQCRREGHEPEEPLGHDAFTNTSPLALGPIFSLLTELTGKLPRTKGVAERVNQEDVIGRKSKWWKDIFFGHCDCHGCTYARIVLDTYITNYSDPNWASNGNHICVTSGWTEAITLSI